jgi:Leucine carboxyl methyltransferase
MSQEVFPNHNFIVRTATDALLAKYSAIVTGGYSPNLKSSCIEIGDDLVEQTSSMNVDNFFTYRELLQSMTDSFAIANTKRQTPLVNAGYAIRVACVLRQVESFVAFHVHCKTNFPVQIIFPGCGLDVTGLWCSSLLTDEMDVVTPPAFAIHVFEIDFPSICESKAQAIRTQRLLDHVESDDSFPARAHCVFSMKKNNFQYALISANLEDSKLMDDIFSDSMLFDVNFPTLVISELVLAYLSIESRETLLRRMASLFRCRGSCTILYEPLGPALPLNIFIDSIADSDRCDAPSAVLESYKSSYCKVFGAKLQKGYASNQRQIKSNPGDLSVEKDSIWHSFYPLGFSTKDVDLSLLRLGFEYVYTSVAGKVASFINCCDWKASELFDEHAALTLHLRSYVVVCAFPVASGIFRRFMCPWMSSAGVLIRCPIPIYTMNISNFPLSTFVIPNFWITTIEKEDEKQIRRLFSDTYKGLAEKYISVRKMVKTALRKDLGSSDVGDDAFVSWNSNSSASGSSILGKRYQELGGDFVVAVQQNSFRHPSTSDGDASKVYDPIFRQVLGAIALRRCTVEECTARCIPTNAVCYEIHRFFVDNKCCACGIGTALLCQVVDAIHRRHCHDGSRLCYIIATTPTVSVSATHFYTKHGFDVQSERETGGLTLRTYLRKL